MHHRRGESNAVSFSVAEIISCFFFLFVSHVAKGGMARQYRRRLFCRAGRNRGASSSIVCLAVLQQAWKKLRHGTMVIPPSLLPLAPFSDSS